MAVFSGTSTNSYESVWDETSESVLLVAGFVTNTGTDNDIDVKCTFITVDNETPRSSTISLPPGQTWSFETFSAHGRLLQLVVPATPVVAQHFNSLEIEVKSTVDDAHTDYSLTVKSVAD